MEKKQLPATENPPADIKAATSPQKIALTSPFIIGVTGGSGGGKTTFCKKIAECINPEDLVSIEMDSFYKPLSPEDRKNVANYNFDSPAALDFDMIFDVLNSLLLGEDVDIPVYDFSKHARVGSTKLKFAPVIIFEGIFALYDERLRNLMFLKVFVDMDDDVRLARRILRDTASRGRKLKDVLVQYNRFVKPAYNTFIKPTMKHADFVVPGRDTPIVTDMLKHNILAKLSASEVIQASTIPSTVIQTLRFGLNILAEKNLFGDDSNYACGKNTESLKKALSELFKGNVEIKRPLCALLAQNLCATLRQQKLFIPRGEIEMFGESTQTRQQRKRFTEFGGREKKSLFWFEPVLTEKTQLTQILDVLQMLALKEVEGFQFHLISFFMCPEIVRQLISFRQVHFYFLMCNMFVTLNAEYLRNTTGEFPSPTNKDYVNAFRSALGVGTATPTLCSVIEYDEGKAADL